MCHYPCICWQCIPYPSQDSGELTCLRLCQDFWLRVAPYAVMCCHPLPPEVVSHRNGNPSIPRLEINTGMSSAEPMKGRRASWGWEDAIALFFCRGESCTGGPWSATTLSFSKAQEEGEMQLPTPLCHDNWSLLSVCMCVAACVCVCVCVCVLVLCWVAGGWEDQRRLCLFIKGHCSGERVAVISSVALLLMLLSCSSTELVITYKSDKHSVSL